MIPHFLSSDFSGVSILPLCGVSILVLSFSEQACTWSWILVNSSKSWILTHTVSGVLWFQAFLHILLPLELRLTFQPLYGSMKKQRNKVWQMCTDFIGWTSLVAQWVESTFQCREHRFSPWPGRFPMLRNNQVCVPLLLSLHAATTEALKPRACAPRTEATAVRSQHTTTKSSSLPCS